MNPGLAPGIAFAASVIDMSPRERPQIVTVVASPPPGKPPPTDNTFIDAALAALAGKQVTRNCVVRASTVRDIDLELAKVLPEGSRDAIRLQIVGHSLSGMLSLGASWIDDADVPATAFRYPYYVLDTNPASLGLLAKYAGKISEVMLVGCNVGSASSFGYAINGRTLTYTLAELWRCLVRGADDVVAPDEFDPVGWYAPGPHRRRPKGWRWVEARPPVWTDPGTDPVPGARTKVSRSFDLLSITSSLLPSRAALPIELGRGIQITCQYVAIDPPHSALPELSIATQQGPAQLLCGGRYLRWMNGCYVVDHNPQLSAVLSSVLWASADARTDPRSRAAG